MTNAILENQVSNLNAVLLSNLDEGAFFSQLSAHFVANTNEYKVLVYEVFSDGSTLLRAAQGKAKNKEKINEKGQGISGYVARTKRAYYSNSAKRDPLLSGIDRDDKVQAELCVPVISDGNIIATVNFQSDKEDRSYSEVDVNFVLKTLNEIEHPVRNLKMYLLAKHLNRELLQKIEEKNKELSTRTAAVSSNNYSEELEIIGRGAAFNQLSNMVARVAKEDFPVLVQGASGSGKKLTAKHIHSLSARNNRQCVIAHCAAIDDYSLEVELFGKRKKKGLIEQANGGTLVLHDVSELSLNLQAKILRMMVSGEIFRIEGEESIHVNVRIISTSRKDLNEMALEGTFREDLLFRLNTVNLVVPNLKDRTDDIKLLAEYYLNRGKTSDESKMLTSTAIEKLNGYSWPGNIQELRSLMERTYALSDVKFIDESHLPELGAGEIAQETPEEDFEAQTLNELEKKHIIRTLEFLGGNKTRAAKALGITVKTLYNKLHSYGLVQPKA